jgi:hypothetical protein
MIPTSHFFLLAVALNTAGLITPRDSLHAQQAGQHASVRRPSRVPVTLALVDSVPGGVPFRILRRANASPSDVILFHVGADSAALSEAVAQLVLMRRLQGDTAGLAGMARVRRPNSRGRAPRVLPWAGRVINDLHLAGRREIAGVGTARTVEIWLPAQRGRGPMK